MQTNSGYSTNRNVRTRSNGHRASHGYNYRRLIAYCAELNRDRENAPQRFREPMYPSAIEAFEAARRDHTK